jgi:hypothetical protein
MDLKGIIATEERIERLHYEIPGRQQESSKGGRILS